MERKKVLCWSDSPIGGTGFGIVSKHVIGSIQETGLYDIDQLAINFHGDFVDKSIVPWELQPARLLDPKDPHGMKMFYRSMLKKHYDIVWILNDLWVSCQVAPAIEKIRKKAAGLGVKPPVFIHYYPVDCRVKKDMTSILEVADMCVCYTSHGKNETLKVMPHIKEKLYEVPHGVDTAAYHPLSPEQKAKLKKQYLGVDPDTTVVMQVNRNSARKQLPYSILAFAEFRKQVPNSVMYLHTMPNDRGAPLLQVLDHVGLTTKDVMFPLKYSPANPAPTDIMNCLYNCGDIFLTTHLGEGWGLCLAPETQIDTLAGSIQIQDIEAGDQVMGRDGLYRAVLDKTQRKVSNIYTVKPMGSPAIRVTQEHPFLVTRTQGKSCGWVKVTDLKKDDMIAMVKPKEKQPLPEYLDLVDYIQSPYEEENGLIWKKMGFSPKTGKQIKIKRKIPLDGRFLSFVGWYLAEGSNDGGRRIELDLHADEVQIARSIQSYLLSTFGVESVVDFNGANKCRLRVSSSLFAEAMSTLCGNHARNKRIPSCFMKSPHLIGLLVRSLFGGDGSLVHRSRSLSSISPSLAYQVRSICAANNILINISYFEKRDIYNCVIYPGHIDRWNKFTEEGVKLPPIGRKSAQHFIETDDYFFLPIKDIRSDKENLDVYDICVDQSHSFTGNGVLLHNTITEAMACGVPVVAPNNTSMPQQLGLKSERGYMYECKDKAWIDPSGFRDKGLIEDIVEQMMKAHEDNQEPGMNKKAMKARVWSEAHDWNKVNRMWVNLFDKASSVEHKRVMKAEVL